MKVYEKILICMFVVALAACSKKSNSSDSAGAPAPSIVQGGFQASNAYASQSVLSAVTMVANASEGSETTMITQYFPKASTSVNPSPTCSASSVRPGPCQSGVLTTNWGGCGLSFLNLTGGLEDALTLTASGAPDDVGCNALLGMPGLLPDGDTLTRIIPSTKLTFAATSPAQALVGWSVNFDTHPGAAWDGTVFSKAALGSKVSRSGQTRLLTLNGAHETLTDPSGKVYLDVTHSGELTMTGSLDDQTRSIATGSGITTWDNITQSKAVHTFNNDANGKPVTWADKTCCYPTQGEIITIFSGSIHGITALVFGSPCGNATFLDTNMKATPIQLGQCY